MLTKSLPQNNTLQPALVSNVLQLKRGGKKGQEKPDPPLPGRRKRNLAQQQEDLLANLADVNRRLQEQRRQAEIKRQEELQKRLELEKQRQLDIFLANKKQERLQGLTAIGILGVSAARRGTPLVFSQTLEVKHGVGDDSNVAADVHFLVQRIPLAGLVGVTWLRTQPRSVWRFVCDNLAHFNILNFQTLVPDVITLCTSAPKVQNPTQALQILAINLNGINVVECVALMTKYSQINGHLDLIALCNAVLLGVPVFPDCITLKRCLNCGKDPKKNKWLFDLGLPWAKVKEFTERMASETEQVQTCNSLSLVLMPIGADYGLIDLINIWLEVDACSVGDLLFLVRNYGNLQDKDSITADMVARLLEAELLIVSSSNHYETGDGKGQTFIFSFPKGRTRILPEWHIHFRAGGGHKAAVAVGTGWKYKGEKFKKGVKVFTSSGRLPDVLRTIGRWNPPKI